jgi:hypothetical protein
MVRAGSRSTSNSPLSSRAEPEAGKPRLRIRSKPGRVSPIQRFECSFRGPGREGELGWYRPVPRDPWRNGIFVCVATTPRVETGGIWQRKRSHQAKIGRNPDRLDETMNIRSQAAEAPMVSDSVRPSAEGCTVRDRAVVGAGWEPVAAMRSCLPALLLS